jgi:tetratricopeptide (TPR) repeat protein
VRSTLLPGARRETAACGSRSIAATRSEGTRAADLAETREYLGDREAAREGFLEAARLEPENVDAWLGLLRVSAAAGDEATAGRAFREAERLRPDRARLGFGMARDAKARWTEAEEALRRAEEAGNASPWLSWCLARALRARGDLPAAARRLEEAVVRSGGDRRPLQDLIDLANRRNTVPGTVRQALESGAAASREAIRRIGDRRALAAIGEAEPYEPPREDP